MGRVNKQVIERKKAEKAKQAEARMRLMEKHNADREMAKEEAACYAYRRADNFYEEFMSQVKNAKTAFEADQYRAKYKELVGMTLEEFEQLPENRGTYYS